MVHAGNARVRTRADNEVYPAISVIPRRRRIYARTADLSARIGINLSRALACGGRRGLTSGGTLSPCQTLRCAQGDSTGAALSCFAALSISLPHRTRSFAALRMTV